MPFGLVIVTLRDMRATAFLFGAFTTMVNRSILRLLLAAASLLSLTACATQYGGNGPQTRGGFSYSRQVMTF